MPLRPERKAAAAAKHRVSGQIYHQGKADIAVACQRQDRGVRHVAGYVGKSFVARQFHGFIDQRCRARRPGLAQQHTADTGRYHPPYRIGKAQACHRRSIDQRCYRRPEHRQHRQAQFRPRHERQRRQGDIGCCCQRDCPLKGRSVFRTDLQIQLILDENGQLSGRQHKRDQHSEPQRDCCHKAQGSRGPRGHFRGPDRRAVWHWRFDIAHR